MIRETKKKKSHSNHSEALNAFTFDDTSLNALRSSVNDS